MLAVTYGLFGLIIGSFVNVVVFRWGTGRSIIGRLAPSVKTALNLRTDLNVSRGEKRTVRPSFASHVHKAATPLFSAGSGCMSCEAKITWFDLIPVVSWVVLRGRCRACGSRISAQYPLVELAIGGGFALIGVAPLLLLPKILGLFIYATMVAITAYDIRHTIIPEAWVWLFNALAFLYLLLTAYYMLLTAPSLLTTNYLLLTIFSGPLVAFPLFALWLVSRGKWIGLGDAKLALGMGWLLGTLAGIEALMLAFIIGALFSVCILLPLPHIIRFLKKAGIAHSAPSTSYTMKSEIPFGPFLVLACLFQWFTLMYNIPIPFLWQ